MTKIKIKRGIKADLPTLEEGELGFTTDTKEVYVGASGGNKNVIHSNFASKSANYVITDEDGLDMLMITTGSSANVQITLPSAANNSGRKIKINSRRIPNYILIRSSVFSHPTLPSLSLISLHSPSRSIISTFVPSCS